MCVRPSVCLLTGASVFHGHIFLFFYIFCHGNQSSAWNSFFYGILGRVSCQDAICQVSSKSVSRFVGSRFLRNC